MRVHVTRATDLAGRLLRALEPSAALATADELAAVTGTTPDMVRRVMMQLVPSGWVESARGRNGGYQLAVPTSAIALLDLIEAMEGPLDDGRCILAGGPCDGAGCAMHDAWAEARAALTNRLAEIPLDASREGARP